MLDGIARKIARTGVVAAAIYWLPIDPRWRYAGIAIALTGLVWKIVQTFREARRRNEGSRAAAGQAVDALVPARFRRLYAAEKKAYLGTARALTALLPGRRKPGPAPAAFTIHRGNKYSILVPMSILTVVVDVPLFALLIGPHVPPSWRTLFTVALSLPCLYGLVWIVGDAWWMRRTGVDLSSEQVVVALGLRGEFRIPIESVLNVDRIPATVGIDRTTTLRVTPVDRPNVQIELDRRGSVGRDLGDAIGVKRPAAVDAVALYVDRPDALIAGLRARLAQAPCGPAGQAAG